MPRIIRLEPIDSIAAGPGSTILPDGTITNPVPYHAVNVTLDDGRTVQIQRPLTLAKLQAALAAPAAGAAVDGIAPGTLLP